MIVILRSVILNAIFINHHHRSSLTPQSFANQSSLSINFTPRHHHSSITHCYQSSLPPLSPSSIPSAMVSRKRKWKSLFYRFIWQFPWKIFIKKFSRLKGETESVTKTQTHTHCLSCPRLTQIYNTCINKYTYTFYLFSQITCV